MHKRGVRDQRASYGSETQVGGEVGYRVRHESRSGRATRVLVVTEGVLVRRLQSDPALEGVAAPPHGHTYSA